MTIENDFLKTCDSLTNLDEPRRVLADWLEERGDVRGEMLRIVHAVGGLRDRLAGLLPPMDAFIEFHDSTADKTAILLRLRELWHRPRSDPDTSAAAALRDDYFSLFVANSPLTLNRLSQSLRLQYYLQIDTLHSVGLLERGHGEFGITAVDGRFYPVPRLPDIQHRFENSSSLRRNVDQGLNTLVLVPFGLPLNRFIERWQQRLRYHALSCSRLRNLDREAPVWVDRFLDLENIIYYPRTFWSPHHGGHTKSQLLASASASAWDVLLVKDMLEIPRAGWQTDSWNGRPLAYNQSPAEHLQSLPHGEIGWTPETYICRALHVLERQGCLLGRETVSYLISACAPERGVVAAGWSTGRPQARVALSVHNNYLTSPNAGGREAVKVM